MRRKAVSEREVSEKHLHAQDNVDRCNVNVDMEGPLFPCR